MVKIIALYGHPHDPQQFEQFYAQTHGPMVAQLPNLRGAETAKITPNPDGTAAQYYRIGELQFDSLADVQTALASDIGKAVVADLPKFCTGGVTLLTGIADAKP